MPLPGLDRSSPLYASIRRARSALARARYRTPKVHDTAFLAPGSLIAPDLVADEHVFVGPNCTVESGVSIGRWTMLAGGVAIVGADHTMDEIGVPMQFAGRDPLPATRIGEDCWLGHGVKVMVGVTVGDCSIVAAGSVVTRDVPPGVIAAGVPAKVLRPRFETDEQFQEHLRGLKTWEFTGEYNGPRSEDDIT